MTKVTTYKFSDMLGVPVETRKNLFRQKYALELGKLHANGGFMWDISKLPDMVDKVMTGIADKKPPIGEAFDLTKKYFGIKTNKNLYEFFGA